MPLLKMGNAGQADAVAEAYEAYDGPMPPIGVYHGLVKQFRVKKNRKGDMMLNCMIQFKAPEGTPKAKFNNYVVWWNGNVNDKGAPYINQMLDALSGGREAVRKYFWAKGAKITGTQFPAKIEAIGPMRIDADGMPVVINTKKGSYNGDVKLDVASWYPVKGANKADAEDEFDAADDVEIVEDDDDDDVIEADAMTEGDGLAEDDDDVDEDEEVPF